MSKHKPQPLPFFEVATTQSEQASAEVEAFRLPTILDYAIRQRRDARDRMILETVKHTNALRERCTGKRLRRRLARQRCGCGVVRASVCFPVESIGAGLEVEDIS